MEPADRFRLVGTLLDGKYRIDRPVAEGGFGVVYRGHQLRLDVSVAIKVLRHNPKISTAMRAELVVSFLEEAKTMARLKHPNIAQVLDAGVMYGEVAPEGLPWTIFEWLDGQTLADELAARRNAGGRSVSETWALLGPVLDAIAFAHHAGVAHRDLKPANIMLVPQRGRVTPRVLDFGIAKLIEGPTTVGSGHTRTESKISAFSANYAAPEQVSRARTGPWTDVHALGLMLTEVLTDQAPYPASDEIELHARVLDARRPTPALRGKDIGQWEPIIAKSVALTPRDRHANAAELLAELQATLEAARSVSSSNEPAPAFPKPQPPRLHDETERTSAGVADVVPTRPRSARTALTISAAAAVLALVAVVSFRIRNRPELEQTKTAAVSASAAEAPNLKIGLRERRLTSMRRRTAVAALSPKEDQIASIDERSRLVVLDVRTRQRTAIDVPMPRKASDVTWFPDGERLLVQERTLHSSSLWAVKLDGNGERLAEPADIGMVSPDGARLAFVTGGDLGAELWLMDIVSQKRERLARSPTAIVPLSWSPDGRWMLVLHQEKEWRIETWDTRRIEPTSVLIEDSRLPGLNGSTFAVWHPRGYVVFSLAERLSSARGANLYALAVDASTGRARGTPSKLTEWSGVAPMYGSVTTHGRIALLKSVAFSDVHLATLGAGPKPLKNERVLTHDPRSERPSGWLPDGGAVLVTAEPNGKWGIYSASSGDGELKPLTDEADPTTWPELGFDERHLVYWKISETPEWRATLVEIALGGGERRELLSRPIPKPSAARPPPHTLHVSCAPRVGQCAFVEVSNGLAVVHSIAKDGRVADPIAQIPATGVEDVALSPRADQLAISSNERTATVSMKTGEVRTLTGIEGCLIQYFAWDPRGDGMFASCREDVNESRLLKIDDKGRTKTLLRGIGWRAQPVISPDGKQLAWLDMDYGGDVWLLDLDFTK